MKSHFKSVLFLAGIFLASSHTTFASPTPQTKILEEKAISYAKNMNGDAKEAGRKLAQEAIMLGANYSHSHQFKQFTPQECMDELSKLGTDSESFYQKALAKQYKTIAVVDGNILMLVASTGGVITYAILDNGDFCNKEKSTNDTYWAAHIFRMTLGSIDSSFS